MNIRKPIDYSEMYIVLDELIAADLPQMGLYYGIGKLVSCRIEKGTAVAASEYLSSRYPEQAGFSPRNVRRMRDFYRAYENQPELAALTVELGWTQNLVIMDADLTAEERRWYLTAARRFGWSKTELLGKIQNSVHLTTTLDIENPPCYNEPDYRVTENEDDKDTFCVSWEYLQKPDGRVRDEGSGPESRAGKPVSHRVRGYQYRGDRQPCLSSSTAGACKARHQLFRPCGAAAQEQRLRSLRPADRDGPGQSPQHAPHLRRGFCRQDAPPDGLYRPPRNRGSRPVVHGGLRGNLAGCAGWVPGVAA